ncbi:MAG: hypothetical protein JW731_13280 [Bacteroidales bacterium]|nr:hypothetical protein [Bacteroidales bacterium]
MRTAVYMFLILFVAWGCSNKPANQTDSLTNIDETDAIFDEQLAQQLGADDYGMKQYVMAFLKSGPIRSQDSATAANLQRAHLDNILRMAEEGKLVLAGPFLDNGEIRGIYIFNVSTVEEAEALTATDPAIQAGRLKMELHPWYGSAALIKLNEISKKITRKSI